LLRRGTPADAGHTVANPLGRRGRIRYGTAALVVVLLVVVLSVVGVITAGRLSAIVVGVTVLATVALFAVVLNSAEITRRRAQPRRLVHRDVRAGALR